MQDDHFNVTPLEQFIEHEKIFLEKNVPRAVQDLLEKVFFFFFFFSLGPIQWHMEFPG